MTDQSSVTEMFDGIAPHYDNLNHLLSFGIDNIWRRKTSKLIAKHHPSAILDVATGTADLAIRLAHDNPHAQITGIDLSEKMMELGKAKLFKKGLEQRVHLEVCDVIQMPFADDHFDAVTVAFGIRNFADREAGLREMARVCRDNGRIAILEFSHPTCLLVKAPYRWYSRRWIPRVGQKVSKHPSAYRYLPSSVEAFPSGKALTAMMEQVGIKDIRTKVLSGGIATLYYGRTSKNGPTQQ